MANPPDGKDELESRKTRFVPRSDIVDGGASKGDDAARQSPSAPAEAASAPTPSTPSTPGGTVIGRTRLVSVAPAADASAPMPAPAVSQRAAAPTVAGSIAGKTEFVRIETTQLDPVVGWVVVVKGPGRGGFKPVFVGMNSVGRAPSQRICLDFGDETISREEHAFITYDDELHRYWVQSGASNVVKVGTHALDAPHELKVNDTLSLGKTVLRFYPVCGPEFSWSAEVGDA
jgi:hypothetical protein